jgi:MFS family permease
MIYYGSLYITPIWLQSIGGLSSLMAGVVMLPLVISQVVTTTLTGFIVERTGHYKPSLVVGFVIWFAGQAAQLVFKQGTSIPTIIGILLLQGLGLGCTLQSES